MHKNEIDHYTDYNSSLNYLNKALALYQLSPSTTRDHVNDQHHNNTTSNNNSIELIHKKIKLIKQYIEAATLKDPSKVIEICNALLQMSQIDHIIRIGDIYNVKILYYLNHLNDYESAYDTLKEVPENLDITNYVDAKVIQQIRQKLNINSDTIDNSHDSILSNTLEDTNDSVVFDNDDDEIEMNLEIDSDDDSNDDNKH